MKRVQGHQGGIRLIDLLFFPEHNYLNKIACVILLRALTKIDMRLIMPIFLAGPMGKYYI